MSGGLGIVVPCVQATNGSDQVTECDMILAGFGSHRGGDEIHETGFVTSPKIRDVFGHWVAVPVFMWDSSTGGESVWTRCFGACRW